MLKPLNLGRSNQNVNKDYSYDYVNSDKACHIVGSIFKFINVCLNENKSNKEISLFTRTFIKGVLNDKTKYGIYSFIRNMPDNEIEKMLNEIKSELLRK